MTTPTLHLYEASQLGYREAYDLQLELVDVRKLGDGVDTLILCEHPHVITLGRSRTAESNILQSGEVEVVATERGGDVTYHGPGQWVGYPVVLLQEGERDLHRYLRNLEQAVIETLAEFGLSAHRKAGATGVWLWSKQTDAAGAPLEKKICSLGIACRRWVCFHGLALNVATDLAYFKRINPCGFEASVMTSMSAELGTEVSMASVREPLSRHLAQALSRSLS